MGVDTAKADKTDIEISVKSEAISWRDRAREQVLDLIGKPEFPCVFARNAQRKQFVQFTFVEAPSTADISHLATRLFKYTAESKQWDGGLDTAYPLIILFNPLYVSFANVAEYHQFGWKILSLLSERDPREWPHHIPREPHEANWTMCFNNVELFCNMSTPTHVKRRSRNLGDAFAMVINPRSRFDIFAGDTPSGRNTRAIIRSRVDKYDAIPHSPLLSNYGETGAEWAQYSLGDDNHPLEQKCPASLFQSPI